MIQQQSFRDRLPFPAASIMAFLYLTFYLFNRFYRDVFYDFYYERAWYEYLTVFQWGFVILVFTLAILMLVKIPNVGITVTLGLISLITIYWCMIDLSYFVEVWLDDGFSYDSLFGISSIFDVIIFLMLTIQSVATYTRAKMSFCNAVWFLPGILQFTTFSFYLIMILDNWDVTYLFITCTLKLFYALFIMLVGKWLADVSRLKHPDRNRMHETAYNFNAPVSPYTRPSVPVPPMPRVPTPPMPTAPIVPPIVSAPQPQPIAQDPVVQELTRYKNLLDNGIITQEEYDTKKKQLLKL